MTEGPGPRRENFDRERFLELLGLMHRIRAFEEEAIAGQKEGLVRGAIHPRSGRRRWRQVSAATSRPPT